MYVGLRADRIKSIVNYKIEMDPDLKYYIDNDYISKLVDLLIEGVSEAFEENNRQIIRDLTTEQRRWNK